MEQIKKIFIKNGKKFFWKKGDLHTHLGIIKEETAEKAEGIIKSTNNHEFYAFNPNFLDKVKKIKREPQTLLPKDLAIILYYSGLDKNYKVVDAGSGCGLLAITMARIAKKVVTYEIKEKHLKIAEKNIDYFKTKNIEIKNQSIYEGIDETNIDLLTLDLPEPWRVLKHAEKALKNGAYLIAYLPTITQVSKLVEEANEYDFYFEKTIEIFEREWFVQGRKVRPKSEMMGHTAFLTFLRKY